MVSYFPDQPSAEVYFVVFSKKKKSKQTTGFVFINFFFLPITVPLTFIFWSLLFLLICLLYISFALFSYFLRLNAELIDSKPKRNETIHACEDCYTNIHSKNLETTQMFINRWTNTEIVLYLYNGLLLINRKRSIFIQPMWIYMKIIMVVKKAREKRKHYMISCI